MGELFVGRELTPLATWRRDWRTGRRKAPQHQEARSRHCRENSKIEGQKESKGAGQKFRTKAISSKGLHQKGIRNLARIAEGNIRTLEGRAHKLKRKDEEEGKSNNQFINVNCGRKVGTSRKCRDRGILENRRKQQSSSSGQKSR